MWKHAKARFVLLKPTPVCQSVMTFPSNDQTSPTPTGLSVMVTQVFQKQTTPPPFMSLGSWFISVLSSRLPKVTDVFQQEP